MNPEPLHSTFPLLSLLIWLPILGGLITLAFGNERANAARWFASGIALLALVLSVPMLAGFDMTTPAMQFVEDKSWIPAYDIRYHLGVDGISAALIALTTLTSLLAMIGAWTSVDKRVSQYYAAFLILEGLMVGVFSALDAMLFYVFFEGMLIPMFIIIGVWGGPRRVYASIKFFLYTFLGSLFMLIGLIYLYLKGGSWQLSDMYALQLNATEQMWLFFGFLIAALGCHFGMTTRGGTEGVGRSTTTSVVVVAISILIADSVLTQLFLAFMRG